MKYKPDASPTGSLCLDLLSMPVQIIDRLLLAEVVFRMEFETLNLLHTLPALKIGSVHLNSQV